MFNARLGTACSPTRHAAPAVPSLSREPSSRRLCPFANSPPGSPHPCSGTVSWGHSPSNPTTASSPVRFESTETQKSNTWATPRSTSSSLFSPRSHGSTGRLLRPRYSPPARTSDCGSTSSHRHLAGLSPSVLRLLNPQPLPMRGMSPRTPST